MVFQAWLTLQRGFGALPVDRFSCSMGLATFPDKAPRRLRPATYSNAYRLFTSCMSLPHNVGLWKGRKPSCCTVELQCTTKVQPRQAQGQRDTCRQTYVLTPEKRWTFLSADRGKRA